MRVYLSEILVNGVHDNYIVNATGPNTEFVYVLYMMTQMCMTSAILIM